MEWKKLIKTAEISERQCKHCDYQDSRQCLMLGRREGRGNKPQ